MKVFKLYEKNNVKLELVINRKSIFFFRLRFPNVSLNYRNPFKCAILAMERLAAHELDKG